MARGLQVRARFMWLVPVTAALVAAVPAQSPAAAPLGALGAADDAARAHDYETALKALSQAAQGASADELARIRQRQVLYERFLGMPELVDLAKDNPAALVGMAITRDGRNLQGLIRLLELGMTPGAGIGARRIGGGALELQTGPDTTRTIAARELAQLSIVWAAPDEARGTYVWTIEQLRAVLQTGELVTGQPTWLIPFSHLSVRTPGASEDTDLLVFPWSAPPDALGGLVTELLLVGGPPAPVEETTGGTATPNPSGPVSGRPEVTQ